MPGAKMVSEGATQSFASAAASLFALIVVSPARADLRLQLRPELSVAAGYNDNLFFDANLAGPQPSQLAADAVFDLEPRLTARLSAAGHVLTLSADDLERLTVSHQNIRDLFIRLDYLTPSLGRARLSAAALCEHYDAALYPVDSFDLAGGEAGATLDLSPVSLGASYRADGRVYSARTQLDVEQRALGGLHARLHRVLSTDLRYSYLHVSSNAPAALPSPALDRHRVEAALTAQPLSRLELYAAYGVQTQELPYALQTATALGPRSDLQHTVALWMNVPLFSWLSLFARYDLIWSTSDQPAGNYQRNQVLVGATFGHTFSTARQSTSSLAPVVTPGQVTFRFRARRGQHLAVVGDWNGWDAAAAPLSPAGELLEATLALPAGRHEYAFAVDGVVQPPPEAPAYADDGFGGKNGVIVVP